MLREKGFVSVAALFLTMTVIGMGLGLSYMSRRNLQSVNRYQNEVILRNATISELNRVMANPAMLPVVAQNGEFLLTDYETDTLRGAVRRRVYGKRRADGTVIYAFAEFRHTDGLTMYQQTKCLIQKENDEYIFRRLP